MHELHDVLFAAHPGFTKAYEDIRKLHQNLSPLSSQQALPTGHLSTTSTYPIPESPWQSIDLDFITNLPKSKGNDSILVLVFYLSKMAHFIPT
jgi:hypothetical protein